MKIRNRYILASMGAMLLLASCESTSMNEVVVLPPEVESFSPQEGYAGCEVTVRGSSLHNVVGAQIGDAEAEIVQRVSTNSIIIKVPAMATTGRITLINNVGSAKSSTDFVMSYPSPAVDYATLPEDVEVSSKMLIFGQRMSVITGVYLSAAGFEPHQAEILSQNDKEIVIQVPYVEADDAFMSFEYFDGKSLQTTDASLVPLKVARFQPVVTAVSSDEAQIGDIITLTGEYLDKVNSVKLNDGECVITQQTPETLKFLVPEVEGFVDGDNFAALSIVYSDGVETTILNPNFKVKVPLVFFWSDRKLWGQGRDVEEFTSFFSPETGIAYANSMWRTLDAVSYKYQEGTCSAAQIPAVSADEYNSVVPYFFFTGVSAGNLQLNSPAGSASMLKNIFTQNNSANDYRVTGANANCYGTPVLAFLALDETKAGHGDLIQKVRSGNMDDFNEATYPIDTDKKTCGAISISSVANSLKDTQFAPGVFTVGKELDTDVDSYILVLYYNHNGLNSSNRAENVKRIGVLHIKHIDFKLYNNTDAPSSSSVLFDMYWMKHDYTGNE